MKARPILFSAQMVRALLAGTKTQTRRVVKPQPTHVDEGGDRGAVIGKFAGHVHSLCPYGQPGDLLYVKESWRTAKSLDDLDGTKIADKCVDAGYRKPWAPMQFEADGYRCSNWLGFGSGHEIATPGRYRHARFMPRWASRITLRITEVRVERLKEISEADALAEGITKVGQRWEAQGVCATPVSAVDAYAHLWQYINGAGSWAANPWVWAVSFEVIQRNVETLIG